MRMFICTYTDINTNTCQGNKSDKHNEELDVGQANL
jgi:hypothetical protein